MAVALSSSPDIDASFLIHDVIKNSRPSISSPAKEISIQESTRISKFKPWPVLINNTMNSRSNAPPASKRAREFDEVLSTGARTNSFLEVARFLSDVEVTHHLLAPVWEIVSRASSPFHRDANESGDRTPH